MIRFGVDPGARGCGVAMCFNDKLMEAHYEKNPIKEGNDFQSVRQMCHNIAAQIVASNAQSVYIEVPRVYPGPQQKGDQNDLIALAGVSYGLACALPSSIAVVRYFPYEWKGTVRKEIMLARIESRLDDSELANIHEFRKTLRHNVIDSVGILLKAIGRL